MAAFTVVLACLSGCQQYLAVKPDKSMATPTTLKDLQRLLNNIDAMNDGFPALGEETGDDVLLTLANWNSLNEIERNNYIFNNVETAAGRWSQKYVAVACSNIILEGLKDLDEPSGALYNREHMEGGALFFRAHAYFQLVQVFAEHYDESTAGTNPGIVLRSRSAIDEPLIRATVAESYAAIIADLQRACSLLPTAVATPNLPSRAAAYSLLSRTYLTMAQYGPAGLYADSALMLHNVLLDFNLLDTNANMPFPRFYGETIHDSRMTTVIASTGRAVVNPELLAGYDHDDLRRKLFFLRNPDGNHRFKGAFDGINGGTVFNGISTGELYLTRAECLARAGFNDEALTMMNELLRHRWVSGRYEPATRGNTPDVLAFVLRERRKELVYRGLRWMDLRRLAKEGLITGSITRTLGETVHGLPAVRIPHVAYKIPVLAIQEGGYIQN